MDESRENELKKFQLLCGIELKHLKMLDTALTHPTFSFEHRGENVESNQRLEFLGDALLGLIVGEELFKRHPELPEGDLTKMRAALVCENTLADKASSLMLGDYLKLGRGEETTGGRTRPSTLADAFEAITAAIYLEDGFQTARDFVLRQLKNDLLRITADDIGDFKTKLQEISQKKHGTGVSYKILQETGPDHDKRFIAGVFLKGKLLAKGCGHSKKEAEQKAAQIALNNSMINL